MPSATLQPFVNENVMLSHVASSSVLTDTKQMKLNGTSTLLLHCIPKLAQRCDRPELQPRYAVSRQPCQRRQERTRHGLEPPVAVHCLPQHEAAALPRRIQVAMLTALLLP